MRPGKVRVNTVNRAIPIAGVLLGNVSPTELCSPLFHIAGQFRIRGQVDQASIRREGINNPKTAPYDLACENITRHDLGEFSVWLDIEGVERANKRLIRPCRHADTHLTSCLFDSRKIVL